MSAAMGLPDIQPVDAIFEGSSRETMEAIKAWVMGEIQIRMNFAGRAVDFMNRLDDERQRVVQHANDQVESVNVVITDFNKTKDNLRAMFTDIEATMTEHKTKMAAVPELTANVNTLFEEMQIFV